MSGVLDMFRSQERERQEKAAAREAERQRQKQLRQEEAAALHASIKAQFLTPAPAGEAPAEPSPLDHCKEAVRRLSVADRQQLVLWLAHGMAADPPEPPAPRRRKRKGG